MSASQMMSDNRKNKAPAERPKLLVTGASGLLGHALCAAARKNWTVHGVYLRHAPQVADIERIQQDLTRPDCLQELLDQIRPQAVIHTAAMTDVMACEKNPQKSKTINTAIPARFAELCCQTRVTYLFTSTDLVFDGHHAPYDEQAATNPVCAYGEQKARAEEAVLASNPQALVCRLPLMFGISPIATHQFCIAMLNAIGNAKPLKLFIDEYRTPVDIDSAARGLITLLGRTTGLCHLGGRTRISRYDLGVALARSMGIQPTMIKPVHIAQLQLPVARASDCALNSHMAYGMGYDPLPLGHGLQNMVRRFNRLSVGDMETY